MKPLFSGRAAEDRLTLKGLEVLLWGTACGRVSTAALVLTGLIGLASLSNPERGLIAILFLAPITLGISIVFGLLMFAAAVRGFRLIDLGRREHGPAHEAAAFHVPLLFAGAVACGVGSLLMGTAPLGSLGTLASPNRGPNWSLEPLLRLYVVSDVLAIAAAGLAAGALFESTKNLLPPDMKRRPGLLLALAVSYPAASLTIEARMLADAARLTPESLLLVLSVPVFAIGAYFGLRLAGLYLDEARGAVVRGSANEPGAAPAPSVA